MNRQDSTEQRLRAALEDLATALDAPFPQIADWGVMPRALVLGAAEVFEIDLSKGTAEQQLSELIDLVGLTDDVGNALTFEPGRSAELSTILARQVGSILEEERRLARRKHPVKLSVNSLSDEPAGTKLETVNRISALTHSGPETLGPGSKERKSVLVNLYQGLRFGDAPQVTKTDLAALLAKRLGADWDYRCYSTGETITNVGLNRILLAATAYLRDRNSLPVLSVQDEASMYSGEILQRILDTAIIDFETGAVRWDGYKAVKEMVSAGYAHARQTEWPGWYFEYKSLPGLRRRFGGGPHPVLSTTFDYRGVRTWDLKSHSETGRGGVNRKVLLNDRASIRAAVADDGLGFIVLRGEPLYDNETDFYEWHNSSIRGKHDGERGRMSRRLKTGFAIQSLDFYFIENSETLNRLEAIGVIDDFFQGRQASGALRKVKYKLDIARADRESIKKYRVDIPEYMANVED